MGDRLPIDQDLNPARQAELIQPGVFAAVDLALTLKQLHWNLKGPHFLAVHEFLDTVINHARAVADELAERIVTVGMPARGQAEAVATSAVPSVPDAFLSDTQALGLAAERVAAVVNTLRLAQKALADVDPVSEDVVIGAVATLEKDLWMLRSHLP